MKNRSRSGERSVNVLPPGGRLVHDPRWLDPGAALGVFERLLREVDWQRRSVKMFGREVPQPRLIAFQGDEGVSYRYSGGDYLAAPWHPEVGLLRDRLAEELGVGFTSALLNLYRDGADGMGWHADDEPELGREPTIASISLGAARRFLLRNRDDRSRRFEYRLGAGSLLVMEGDLQHHWQHRVPKTARPVGPRINLTFRRILPRGRRSKR
ncbi:alpha-ketoglutarate-dependent dioxygenase AlkB family protein [Halomonas denitrificans]|nr:alpha-ketoglutarate-dependent dioxygenase AlkB [Halomonas denitrificans]